MIKEALNKIIAKENLTFDEAKDAINEIMSGEISPVIISPFLTALAMKGETEEEIAGAAAGMAQGRFPLKFRVMLLILSAQEEISPTPLTFPPLRHLLPPQTE